MEMLKFLTHKLRAQSLNEVQPFSPEEVEEDHDSGTESDEELQANEEAMQEQEEDEENNLSPGNVAPPPLPAVICTTAVSNPSTTPPFHTPPRSSTSPVNSVTVKRPFQLVNQTQGSFQAAAMDNCPPGGMAPHKPPPLALQPADTSPQASSDFERCSLDYEPTSSVEFEHHSSEDELAVINCCKTPELLPEKRKWSQMSRCGSCNDSSGSSDEEVRDLLANTGEGGNGHDQPLNFSSSPPQNVQRLNRTMSPQLFLANVSPALRVCSMSPRKRHRQSNSTDVSDATGIQRPCLDFDKMQVSLAPDVFTFVTSNFIPIKYPCKVIMDSAEHFS